MGKFEVLQCADAAGLEAFKSLVMSKVKVNFVIDARSLSKEDLKSQLTDLNDLLTSENVLQFWINLTRPHFNEVKERVKKLLPKSGVNAAMRNLFKLARHDPDLPDDLAFDLTSEVMALHRCLNKIDMLNDVHPGILFCAKSICKSKKRSAKSKKAETNKNDETDDLPTSRARL